MAVEVGVVVAGGHSERFGDREKALATVDGEPMLRRVAATLASVSDEVVVNCRDEQLEPFAAALDSLAVPLRFAVDRRPGRGPADGLGRALEAVPDDHRVAVCSCDLPFVTPAVFETLAAIMEQHPALAAAVTIDADGTVMPLCGVYEAGPTAAAARQCSHRSVRWLLAHLESVAIDPAGVEDVDPEVALFDVNTRADRRRANRLARDRPRVGQ